MPAAAATTRRRPPLPAGLMQWPSKGVVVMFIFQTARWTDVPIQLKKRSYAGPPKAIETGMILFIDRVAADFFG